jgi:hypothetical protein
LSPRNILLGEVASTCRTPELRAPGRLNGPALASLSRTCGRNLRLPADILPHRSTATPSKSETEMPQIEAIQKRASFRHGVSPGLGPTLPRVGGVFFYEKAAALTCSKGPPDLDEVSYVCDECGQTTKRTPRLLPAVGAAVTTAYCSKSLTVQSAITIPRPRNRSSQSRKRKQTRCEPYAGSV